MTEGKEKPEKRDRESKEPGLADGPADAPVATSQSDQTVQPRRKSKRDRDTYLHSRW